MTNSTFNLDYIRTHKSISTIDRIAGKSPLAVKTATPTKPLTETERQTEREKIADRPNHFADLLREYERATIEDRADPSDRLTDLAYALTFSVLKKLHNVGSEVKPDKKTGEYKNPKGGAYAIVIESLIRGLRADRADLNRIQYAIENATDRVTRINKEGDEVTETVIIDSDCNYAVRKLCADTLSDGSDLVNTAVVALLEETEKAKERAPLAIGFMEVKYSMRKLKKCVRIKEDDSVNGWETVETTPIQRAFQAVRRAVENTRAIQNASDKFTYLEYTDTDPDTGREETVYRRLPMYSNLAGEVTDISGKVTYITADQTTVDRSDELLKAMNLTAREASVLKYRLSGYGNKAIATRLGVSENVCKGAMTRIRQRATVVIDSLTLPVSVSNYYYLAVGLAVDPSAITPSDLADLNAYYHQSKRDNALLTDLLSKAINEKYDFDVLDVLKK